MRDRTSIAGHLLEVSPSSFDWLGADRWPEEIIDAVRFPGMGVARTVQHMMEIGRLRYELYIERDRKRYAHADHEARTFLEPVDRLSLNFLARIRGLSAITVRATWAGDAILDPHLEQLVAHIDLKPDDFDQTIVNSRLAAQPSTAAWSLITPLFQSMFIVAHRVGARFCVAATRSPLIPLFERFGFYQLEGRRPYFDETAGWMSVLLLDLRDRDRLARTRSPFLAVYDEFGARDLEK